MVVTKAFLVIFGLILIGSSFSDGKPRLFHLQIWKDVPNLFQDIGTTFKVGNHLHPLHFEIQL